MKKIISLIIAAVAVVNVYAAERRTITAEEAEKFYNTTTYVVLTNDNIILDAFLSDAVKKNWKITPYKVIGQAEFDKLKTDDKNSFLLITRVVDKKDKGQHVYLYLSLLMGNKDAEADINNMPEAGFMPMACENQNGEANPIMIEPMVLFVQKNVENIKNGILDKNLLLNSQDRMSVYNYNMDNLKGKIIYVDQADVATNMTTERLNSMFGSNLYVVKSDDISRIISEKDPKSAIAFTIYPFETSSGSYAYKMVMSLDGELYYYYREARTRNFRFAKKDFDQLRRPYNN
jgi:hypothetical protein